ncbi:unnamed protein product [Pleuronectes platessa]|uniref:Uncharacterized protein n=1 Tax=Pleuronectes platessa TaxID=8262 RepID=A0A9N7THB9_PLEPL|nr:unnamed protein product [Pleuronectes platessa]
MNVTKQDVTQEQTFSLSASCLRSRGQLTPQQCSGEKKLPAWTLEPRKHFPLRAQPVKTERKTRMQHIQLMAINRIRQEPKCPDFLSMSANQDNLLWFAETFSPGKRVLGRLTVVVQGVMKRTKAACGIHLGQQQQQSQSGNCHRVRRRFKRV